MPGDAPATLADRHRARRARPIFRRLGEDLQIELANPIMVVNLGPVRDLLAIGEPPAP